MLWVSILIFFEGKKLSFRIDCIHSFCRAKGVEQLGDLILVFLNTDSEWIDEYLKTDNSLLESQNKSSLGRD